MLAFALLAGAGIAVIEARVGDEEGHAALGRDIAARLGALPATTVSARLREASSSLSSENRVEPILEADRLVETGKDAYLEGRFAEAIEQLERARGLMASALETIEEERQAAQALFRAELYLAFTLRAQGAGSMGRAREVMREAIRSFPSVEPPTSEYGPENLRFFREVKTELEQGPMGRVRIRTVGAPANVYLNGRLAGVTPLDLQRVLVGSYRLHLRRGNEGSRLHAIEVRAGNNEYSVDVGFDRAIRDDDPAWLAYSSAAARAEQRAHHAVRLAETIGVEGVLVYWVEDSRVMLLLVEAGGAARIVEASVADAPGTAVALREGRIGASIETRPAARRRVWTWVVGGLAVASLTVGVILGRSFQGDLDTLDRRYPDGNVWDPRDLMLRDDARAKGDAANVFYGVAGAAVVGTILLYVLEGGSEPARGRALAPIVSPTLAGVNWSVRF